MTGFLVVKEAFIPYDTNLVFWLGLLLFKEEFGILEINEVCFNLLSLVRHFRPLEGSSK